MALHQQLKIDTVPNTVPEDLQEDIRRAVQILKEEGCSEIYLFGSVAAGKIREDSDLDIAIRGCPRGHFFHLLGRLLWELNHSVDLINLDTQDVFAQHLQQAEGLLRIG
jgi:predicted nucleotidyltransferase